VSAALITPNVCHLGAAALAHVPVGHAMGDDGKAYDLVGFFSQHLTHAVARHVHAGHDSKDQLAVFAAACIEMMRPLVPDLAQRAHELCFPDDFYETHTSVGVIGGLVATNGCPEVPAGIYLQDLSDADLRETITDDGEPLVLGHTLCFSYRGHSYSLHDQPDYFGVGDVIHVLPAGTGDAVWVAEDTATFGTYACCVKPIQMKEGTSHV